MSVQAHVVICPQEPGPLRLEDVSLPEPSPHQVVLKVFASGVCHTQLHAMHRERVSPRLLGHEATGVVVAAGRGVTYVGEGDRVLISWVPRDRASVARELEIAALPLADGSVATSGGVFTWADHTLADEQYLVRLPDDVPTDVTAIIGCPVMTGAGAVLNTAGVRAGQTVAVFGAGGVGLVAIMAASIVGATPMIAVDLSEEKLAFARRFGSTHGVDASQGDPVPAIQEITGGGVDFAFDCIGAPATVVQALLATKPGAAGGVPGGTAVLVGMPMHPVEMPMVQLLLGRTYIGSIGGSSRPARDFPRYLDWHRQGHLDLNALVTDRFRLDQINEATDALERGQILGRAILEM